MLEKNYALLSYLDMELFSQTTKFLYPSTASNDWAWELLSEGYGCCDITCHQLCYTFTNTDTSPPKFMCSANKCEMRRNPAWTEEFFAHDESVIFKTNNPKKTRIIGSNILLVKKNIDHGSSRAGFILVDEVQILNEYSPWINNLKALEKENYLAKAIDLSIKPRGLIETFVQELIALSDGPFIAVHLDDFYADIWGSASTSLSFATAYTDEMLAQVSQIPSYKDGTIYLAYDESNPNIQQIVSISRNNFVGTVVTKDDVPHLLSKYGTIFDKNVFPDIETIVDLWACVSAPALFIGKSQSLFSETVDAMRYIHHPPSEYISSVFLKGVCSSDHDMAGGDYGLCTKGDRLDFISRVPLISDVAHCNICSPYARRS